MSHEFQLSREVNLKKGSMAKDESVYLPKVSEVMVGKVCTSVCSVHSNISLSQGPIRMVSVRGAIT